MTSGSQRYRDPDGKLHNTRQIHGLTRDRRNGELNYTRTRAEQRRLLVEQGCTFEKEDGKHRYVHFAGDHRTKRLLKNALKWDVVPHPRRSNNAESDEAVDELAKGGDATLRTNRDWSCVAGIAACEEQSTARTAEKADGVSNTYCEDSSMVERPVRLGDGGSILTSSLHFVRIEKALATELVIKHHYLHRKPLVSWAFGIIRDSQLVGVCTFGKPMWSVQVGVTGGALSDVRKNKGRWRDVFELNRLWIADDVTDHCIESKFVAWCLRELKKENPNLILISYADGSVTNSVTQKNHVGVVYQAGGWIYTGLSSPWVDITIEGKDHRSVPKKMQGDKIGNRRTWAGVSAVRKTRSRKHRYVKFLNPKDEGLLAWKREPRPRKVM